jgi:uncharacterized protein YbcV (DUF1398 family)
MDAQTRSIAQDCLDASHDGTMAFPAIIGKLMAAGFEGYAVDYRGKTTTYYLADGGSVVLENRNSAGAVAAPFNAEGVGAEVRRAQANEPGYTYPSFCEAVKGHGCAGYIVSFPGRRVVYYGRTAEMHVEHFPQ